MARRRAPSASYSRRRVPRSHLGSGNCPSAGRRCIAFDARGHGRSSKPSPPYAWRDFGADAAALAESLQLEGAVGVGHSLGGHAITLAAALCPGAFAGLVLLDPVIRPKDRYTGPWTEAPLRLQAPQPLGVA